MPAMEGMVEERWEMVGSAQEEVWRGSRQAPPWIYLVVKRSVTRCAMVGARICSRFWDGVESWHREVCTLSRSHGQYLIPRGDVVAICRAFADDFAGRRMELRWSVL